VLDRLGRADTLAAAGGWSGFLGASVERGRG
jgi:hypothetical protein